MQANIRPRPHRDGRHGECRDDGSTIGTAPHVTGLRAPRRSGSLPGETAQATVTFACMLDGCSVQKSW
jgi:hypothetical protein